MKKIVVLGNLRRDNTQNVISYLKLSLLDEQGECGVSPTNYTDLENYFPLGGVLDPDVSGFIFVWNDEYAGGGRMKPFVEALIARGIPIHFITRKRIPRPLGRG